MINKIIPTDNPEEVILRYEDVTSVFGGVKRAVFKNKGIYNSRIAEILSKVLEDAGVPTAYIRSISDREQLCRKTEPLPFQMIVRNRLAGTTAELLGVEEGARIPNVVYEIRYTGGVRRPLINRTHLVALGVVTAAEYDVIFDMAVKINDVLKSLYLKAGIELVDFKMECGRTTDGRIVLSDAIDPDNSRLWDIATGERLDKDRFRYDMARVATSYREVMERLEKIVR